MNLKLLGGAALLLLGVGGFLAYEEYQKKQERDRLDALQAADAERDAEKKRLAEAAPPKQGDVPDLKGMTEDEARAALKAAGFVDAKLAIQPENYTCDYDDEKNMLPLDTVCAQDPGPRSRRSVKDFTIKVTIERETFERGTRPGYEWIRMPDLEGLPLPDARQLLADKGFTDAEFEIVAGVCDRDIVCDTIPDKGQRKRTDSKGTLKVGGYKP